MQITVNGNSDRWLRQGFPWVYPNEIVKGKVKTGALVTLYNAQGALLGTAIADQGWIAARRFRTDEGPLDKTFFIRRLRTCLSLRQAVLPPDTTAWRLVHGENDGLPGVRVDIYGEFVVISLDSPSLMSVLEPLVAALHEVIGPIAGIYVEPRPDPREKEPQKFPLQGHYWGKTTDGVVVMERGIKALVYPGRGKDIGIYPDMREVRRFLEPAWKKKRVLNLFAHTGFFSVVAACGGATEVVTTDLSPHYLDDARENFRQNGLAVEDRLFLAEDSFKVLDRYRRQKVTFDIVVADPPGYSHSAGGSWSGEKDYPRLVAACLQVVASGGWLVCASNLGTISPKQFQGFLDEGARRAGRRLVVIHEGTAAPDFPAALDFPEARYLKVWVCAVMDL